MSSGNNIKVVCRFRPMNRMELDNRSDQCIDISDTLETVRMRSATTTSASGSDKDGFTFDRVFPPSSAQAEIFDFGVKGIVDDVMDGFNGTLFCYGQTGSGKTYTMMGSDIMHDGGKGLIPRITEQIFKSIVEADANIEYTVKVSYMEIYMEKIKDLLAPANDNLSIHEDKSRGVYVKGLTDVYVSSGLEVFQVMKAGGKSRAISATNMNAESSRSHSIFVMGIHQRNVETGSQKSGNLYLVDLAGSEKVGKTGATGQTLEEAKKINKSLSALGMVINSLTDGKSSHIPYRDSKLTRILQESLGGNSRTTLIINCSPASFNEAETLSTLRFGMRAKSIKNKARVNAEMSPAELKVLLGKTKGDLVFCETYRDALLGEVAIWRIGNSVPESDWATEQRVRTLLGSSSSVGRDARNALSLSTATATATTGRDSGLGSSLTNSRSTTPAFDGLPGSVTPGSSGRMDSDERDDFLRRENELNDMLAEKESVMNRQEVEMDALRKELEYVKEKNEQMIKSQSTIGIELAELRTSQKRVEDESRENQLNLETAKDRELSLSQEIAKLQRELEDLKRNHATSMADEREKRKADMLADMMASIDSSGAALDSSARDVRVLLDKLDKHPEDSSANAALLVQSRDLIRKHLFDSQSASSQLQDRLRQAQEDIEMLNQGRSELEELLAERGAAYEDLLAQQSAGLLDAHAIAELKTQYESQASAKENILELECAELRKRIGSREDEITRLQKTIEDQNAGIENLNRMLESAASTVDGGQEFAKAVHELDKSKRAVESQAAEFELMRRNLMRDVTDRCEKVVELQIQLDEVKEKYKAIAKSTNAKAHNKKMQILEYNLSQLNEVQRGLMNQNTTLKKELNAAERKLAERKDRIVNLERSADQAGTELRMKEAEFQHVARDLHEQLSQALAREQAVTQGAGLPFGRIAKPLRGGGGGGAVQGYGGQFIPGGFPATASNPLQRIAATTDDAIKGSPRQSWFFNSRA